MHRINNHGIIYSILCLSLIIPAASFAADLPADVRKSLEQNAARMSPITGHWTYQLIEKGLRSHLPKDVLANSDDGALLEQHLDYKFKGGRYYFRREFSQHLRDSNGKMMNAPERFVEEKSYDGQRVYMYSAIHKGKEPHLVGIFPKNTTNVLFDNYFERAGYRLPDVDSTGKLTGFVPELLGLLKDGETLVSVDPYPIDGKDCLRVVVDSGSAFSQKGRERHEFFLDRGASCALRRHEVKNTDGVVLMRVELLDIQRVGAEDGPWLPMACRTSYFQYKGFPKVPSKTPVMEDVHRVESFSLADIPDEDFALTYLKPGMVVGDATLPGAEKTKRGLISYTVPADPATLDRVIQRAMSQQVPLTRGGMSSRNLLIALNVLVLVVIASIYLWRRRSRHAGVAGTN